MDFRKWIKNSLTITLIAAFLLQISACGTIMYPERKGQIDGKVDPNVAILDGLGLLLFIIPGVIAFAVDFSNGTIYLPSGKKSLLQDDDSKNLTAIHIGKDKMDYHEIESVVLANTGINIDMDGQNIQIVELGEITEFTPNYAKTVTQ